MTEDLKGLREERVYLQDTIDRIRKDVDLRTGIPTNARELRELDEATAEIAKLDRQIADDERREEVTKQRVLDTHERRDGLSSSGFSNLRELSERDQHLGFNAWCRPGSSVSPTDEGREAAQRMGLDLNNRSIKFNLGEQRAMSTQSATYGAKAIPVGFVNRLEQAMLAYGNVASVATVISTDGGEELRFPTSNDTAHKGRLILENTQAQNDDISISEIKLGSYFYDSNIVLVSTQLLQDQSIDLSAHIGRMLGERLGRITNEHLTTGTGTDQPNGVLTAATLGATAASTAAVTYAELVNLQHSVDPSYGVNGTWMFNFNTLAALKKIVDADGRPLWQPAAVAGMGAFPETLLNRPIVVNQQMPDLGASAKPILFGDFSRYYVRQVRGVEVMRLNERYADWHQIAFLASTRLDGELIDAGTRPIRFLQMAAS